jgi:hypothetical protein
MRIIPTTQKNNRLRRCRGDFVDHSGFIASVRDLTAQVIDARKTGSSGHGVNVKPGKPTILLRSSTGFAPKPVLGLPGSPVSALVIASVCRSCSPAYAGNGRAENRFTSG